MITKIDDNQRQTVINFIETNLNKITSIKPDWVMSFIRENQILFDFHRKNSEGNHGIFRVTDNGDYVTVKTVSFDCEYDTQGIFDALNNFSLEGFDNRDYYDIWDYLNFCKYTENQDNKQKPVEKSIEKPVKLCSSIEKTEKIISDLIARVYELEQEVKQLKKEKKLDPNPKKKPTTKKQSKFKLPENFADYQQECDDLIEGLSCLYNIKKGKWNGNILQFILTPTDTEKAKHPYPDKWKAGLYLQPGQWTVDKVSMSDPDDWEDWFMDINDFADANDIEIS